MYLTGKLRGNMVLKSRSSTQICPFGKSKLNINLYAPASPVHRAKYSTIWDRKG